MVRNIQSRFAVAVASARVVMSRPLGMMTSVAPLHSAPQISNVATSKDMETVCATRSPERMASIGSSRRAHMLRCSTMTPLGVPVDPDVYTV